LDYVSGQISRIVVLSQLRLYGRYGQRFQRSSGSVTLWLTRNVPTGTGLLWDTHSRRPKSEEEISDYLKIELESQLLESGVVVNREVQVRRIKPTGLPERTDLRIEALPRQEDQPAGPLKIPGEVKGAWNAGVTNSVESQLIDRYMADFQTSYGIYIAIWFDLESWTDNDSRKKQAASHGSREHLDSALKEQATKQLENGKKIAVVVLDASLRRPTATSFASGSGGIAADHLNPGHPATRI
jgi:hypothetical protein